MDAWYVFHTRPHYEPRAIEALIARGVTTYVPRLRSGSKGPTELLFPTCLFVYGDPVAAGKAKWQYLPGLGELIAFGGEPVIVPPRVIAWLRAQDGDFIYGAPAVTGRAVEDGFLMQLQVGWQAAGRPQDRVATLLRCLSQASESAPLGAAAADDITPDTKPRHHRSTRGRGRRIACES